MCDHSVLSQSDSPMSESFWQKNRMVTSILFDLCLHKHFIPVANFGYQSLYGHADFQHSNFYHSILGHLIQGRVNIRHCIQLDDISSALD